MANKLSKLIKTFLPAFQWLFSQRSGLGLRFCRVFVALMSHTFRFGRGRIARLTLAICLLANTMGQPTGRGFLITTTGGSLLLSATDASAILTAINLTTVAAWTYKIEHATFRCATKTLTESFQMRCCHPVPVRYQLSQR